MNTQSNRQPPAIAAARKLLAAAFVLAVVGLARPAFALARHFTLDDLTATATVAVHATVNSETAAWDAANAKIWTTYGLTVTETLKDGTNGVWQKSPVAHIHGGTIGDKAQKTSGEPTLDLNGEYVLFLWKDEDGHFRILGQSQGVFIVSREEGQVPQARNNYRGSETVKDADGIERIEKVGPIIDTLDSLKTRTKKIVADAVAAAAAAAPAESKAADKPAEKSGAAGAGAVGKEGAK